MRASRADAPAKSKPSRVAVKWPSRDPRRPSQSDFFENSGRSIHHFNDCFGVLVATWDLDPKMLKIKLKVFNIFPVFEADLVWNI